MHPVSAFIVFVMIWWTVIFCILPIGLSTSHEELEDGEKGIRAPGAPKVINMKRKLLITTIISIILWGITVTIIGLDYFDLRDFALQG